MEHVQLIRFYGKDSGFFLSHLPDVHDRLTKKGDFALRLAIAKKSHAKLIITGQNFRQLGLTVRMLHRKNVREVQILFPGKPFHAPGVVEAEPYISQALQLLTDCGMTLLTNNYPFWKPPDLELDLSTAHVLFRTGRSKKPKASVIILTCDRRQYLLRALDALSGQSERDFEAVIVDDNSQDRSSEAVRAKKYLFQVTYVYWPRKKPFVPGTPCNRAGPARNLGANHAKGKHLIFIDGDIVVSPEFVSEHILSHGNKTLVAGPSVRERERRDVREDYFTLCQDSLDRLPVPWAAMHSGNLSIRRSDFLAAGGFDSDFVHWGMEDDEFAYRLMKAGYSFRLNRRAFGYHLWHPPEFVDSARKHVHEMQNAQVFYKKHLDPSIFHYYFDEQPVQPSENRLAMGGVTMLRFTESCNNNCRYCGFLGFRDMKPVQDISAVAEMESGRIMPGRLIIVGSELSKDFFKNLQQLRSRSIELVTNGRAFAVPGFAEKALASGLRRYLVMIFGEEARHDAITGVPGSFRQAYCGMTRLRRLGALVAVHLVLDSVSHRDFHALVRHFRSADISDFHVTVVPPEYDAGFRDKDFLGFVRRLIKWDLQDMNLRNEFFSCFRSPAEIGTVSDLKRCLHCCIMPECMGRPEALLRKKQARVFFRDDDVGPLTRRLKSLVELFISMHVPISLQVVPAKLTDECAAYIREMMRRHPDLIDVGQHGLSHDMHCSLPGRMHEFGSSRSLAGQVQDIKAGQKILSDKIRRCPVFTPPFNHYDSNTVRALRQLGFRLVSSGHRPLKDGALPDIPAQVDPVAEYSGSPVFRPWEETARMFSLSANLLDTTGILLHHELLDDRQLKSLASFIGRVKQGGYELTTLSRLAGPRVLLIQPAFPNKSALVCEPTGLLSLAGMLEYNGYDVRILDMNLKSSETELRELLEEFRPAYVGITAVTPQILNAYRAVSIVRQSLPDTHMILGGVHATFMPEEALKHADYVIIGEGEQAIADLIEAVETGKSPAGIPGIAYLRDGKAVFTKGGSMICSLDSLPWPSYHLVPIGLYRTSECMIPKARKRAIHLMTSRGCPNNCSFCASPALYKRRVRFASVGEIISQLKHAADRHGIGWAHFHDDNFLLDPARVQELCQGISGINTRRLKWTCLANVSTINRHPEVLRYMKASGCIGIEVGVESGDPDVFAFLKKNQSLDDIRLACRAIRAHGLPVMCLMMAYSPGETIDSPYKSIRLLKEMGFSTQDEGDSGLQERGFYLMGHMARASPGSAFYQAAPRLGRMLARGWHEHYEENISFVPNTLVEDVPCRLRQLSRQQARGRISKHSEELEFYRDCSFYVSREIISESGSMDAFMAAMADVYCAIDGSKPLTMLIGQLGFSERTIIAAASMLSILRLIGSKGGAFN